VNQAVLKRNSFLSCIIFLSFFTRGVYAQYSSLSVSASAGLAIPNYTLGPLPGFSFDASLIYSPLRFVSLSADMGKHFLMGEGNVNFSNENSGSFIESTTQLFVYGGSLHVSLNNILKRNPPQKYMTYLFFGTGMTDLERQWTVNKNQRRVDVPGYNNYISWLGLSTRIKRSNRLDYQFKIQYYRVESKYLDMVNVDDKLDHYLTLSLGIFLNYSGKPTRPHIQWRPKDRCPSNNF
jgi:hypothetical protein